MRLGTANRLQIPFPVIVSFSKLLRDTSAAYLQDLESGEFRRVAPRTDMLGLLQTMRDVLSWLELPGVRLMDAALPSLPSNDALAWMHKRRARKVQNAVFCRGTQQAKWPAYNHFSCSVVQFANYSTVRGIQLSLRLC